MSNYSLRARENLRPPGGIMATLENDQTRLMPKAKRKRSGKGNQIQHQIREIRELVTNRGSRTKLSYLKSSLNDSLKEAVFLHEAYLELLDESHKDYNDEWIDNLTLDINTCFADIDIYFQSRVNDPPSSGYSERFSETGALGENIFKTRQDIEQWRSKVESSNSLEQEEDIKQRVSLSPKSQRGTYFKNGSEIADAFSLIQIEDRPKTELKKPPQKQLPRTQSCPSLNIKFAPGGNEDPLPDSQNTSPEFCVNTSKRYFNQNTEPTNKNGPITSHLVDNEIINSDSNQQNKPVGETKSKVIHHNTVIENETNHDPHRHKQSLNPRRLTRFLPAEGRNYTSTQMIPRTGQERNDRKLNEIDRTYDLCNPNPIETFQQSKYQENFLPQIYYNQNHNVSYSLKYQANSTNKVEPTSKSCNRTYTKGGEGKIVDGHTSLNPTIIRNKDPIGGISYHLNPEAIPFKATDRTLPINKNQNLTENFESISQPSAENPDQQIAVDQWIDELDPFKPRPVVKSVEGDISMQLLIQQRLPRVIIDAFDGTPEKWIDFVVKFYDSVHQQVYLSDSQKKAYLLQHLAGEALKAVQGFGNDTRGYFASLKRLKYIFGHKGLVAQAVIRKVTKGKALLDHDINGLTEFYYELSGCLNTLKKMCYYSDIYSTDVLRQVVRKLPNRLLHKWSENSLRIRNHREPNLADFEKWLQDRIMASKDPCLPKHLNQPTKHTKKIQSIPEISSLVTQKKQTNRFKCINCGGDHLLYKCTEYVDRSPKAKLSFVKSKRLCFNCLQPHQVKVCESKHRCYVKSCKSKHHTSLHDALSKNNDSTIKSLTDSKKSDKSRDGSNDSTEKSKTSKVNCTSSNRHVYLQVVPVRIRNSRGQYVSTYALLDPGSQCTIIRKDISDKLNLPGIPLKVDIGTVMDKGQTTKIKEVEFELTSMDGQFVCKVSGAYTLEKTNFNVPGQILPPDFGKHERWNYVKGCNIESVSKDKITLLVGADIPNALWSIEVKRGPPGLPFATKTPFGWALIGVLKKFSSDGEKIVKTVGHLKIKKEKELEQLIEQFWKTETFGTEYDYKTELSIQDQEVIKYLEKETKLIGNHYEVPMLWKQSISLHDNYSVAAHRLEHLLKRFRKDETFYKMYKRNIDEYLAKGYARKLSPEENLGKGWYLPHHGVLEPNKPGKVRTVFDAAAKYNGRSLNDNLITGPDLLNNLVGVLLRFRKYEFAIAGDVEAMFHQVKLRPEDCDKVRFLWKEDIHNEGEPDHFQMLVHIFGAKCSPCCASFALRKTAEDNESQFNKEVVQTVIRNFYMDDLLKSFKSEEEALTVIQRLIMILEKGGFTLRKFLSTSQNILKEIPPDKRAIPKTELHLDETLNERALGVKWNLKSDCFTFASHVSRQKHTKRGILRVTSSIFDPLGLLAPYVLRAKLIIQELWRQKVNWDDEVDDRIDNLWSNWLKELNNLQSFVIPRWLGVTEEVQQTQLHIFCDASESAFAAVAYIRLTTPKENTCRMIMSKSRVAPLKPLTLPRLELQGAVLAIRLKKFIIKEIDLQFQDCFFWTDSTLNLQYMQNESKRFKVFVANRVAEIRKHSNVQQWHHIEGKNNPADLATRGLKIDGLISSSLWFNGPTFLCDKEESWPTATIESLDPQDTEIRKRCVFGTNVENQRQEIVVFERFSKWGRLIRTLGWILVFIENFRNLKQQSKATREVPYRLNNTEHQNGKNLLIKLIQQDLTSNQSSMVKLDPHLDKDGILRVGGRLKHALIPYAAKHQIILPYKHHAVKLLIEHYHDLHHHCGKDLLLSILQQEYWIIKGRSFVKQVISSCVTCKKLNPRTLQPKMADLPTQRIDIGTTPFQHTGVDYFGPITVKILRSRAKRWGCIFTCLSTRAVHLELSSKLDTDAFINTLERFTNRRGRPQKMYSDCGTNFKGAEKELKESLQELKNNQATIKDYAQRKGMEWSFNPPESPHMGGSWERLIRSIKTTLKVILSNNIVDDFTLMTALTEAEALINSRPLTPVSDDINDLEALTPSHFLIGRANLNLAPCITSEVDMNHRKRWKQAQELTNQFWRRWVREYLPCISPRPKWSKESHALKVGDLVVLKETSARGIWPIGRIVEIFPGKDGIVRVVNVKTKDGVYKRPVVKLSLLLH